MDMGIKYLTTDEVAAEFRINRRTVTRMLIAGRLQGTRIAGRWRIPAVAVGPLLDAKTNAAEVQKFFDANRALPFDAAANRDEIQRYFDANRA